MGDSYVGEIRMFGGNFAPYGWAFCDGSLLSISEYDVLYNLIGTTYGGDGQRTFGLPDLRGRVPVHQGSGLTIGQMDGAESSSLLPGQLPEHSHPAGCTTNPGNNSSPATAIPAENSTALAYVASVPPSGNMNPAAMTSAGGNQPHDNMQPYLCISFIISLFGIYPTQS